MISNRPLLPIMPAGSDVVDVSGTTNTAPPPPPSWWWAPTPRQPPYAAAFVRSPPRPPLFLGPRRRSTRPASGSPTTASAIPILKSDLLRVLLRLPRVFVAASVLLQRVP
jgi:hypothetical protein